MKKAERLTYNIIGNFAKGGIAVLEQIVLGDGSRALLRRLQSGKIFNIAQQKCFRNGIRLRAALSPHPNLVNSLEIGVQGLRPYEIIEFIEGQNLKVLFNDRNEVLRRELLFIITECAEGLAWVHANGFMHLDVKPENFILRLTQSKPVVKLTDFDLAHKADWNAPHKQMGTPAYMAPEQLKGKKAFQASDVFAFSIMAYQLATGKAPFIGNSLKEVYRKQASSSFMPKPPSELVPDLPPVLSKVIMTGLEKTTAKRYPDMRAFLADLKG